MSWLDQTSYLKTSPQALQGIFQNIAVGQISSRFNVKPELKSRAQSFVVLISCWCHKVSEENVQQIPDHQLLSEGSVGAATVMTF